MTTDHKLKRSMGLAGATGVGVGAIVGGGSDIMMEMYQAGELQQELAK